jgi:hypothetical protein
MPFGQCPRRPGVYSERVPLQLSTGVSPKVLTLLTKTKMAGRGREPTLENDRVNEHGNDRLPLPQEPGCGHSLSPMPTLGFFAVAV